MLTRHRWIFGCLFLISAAAQAAPRDTEFPFILWTRGEAAAIKKLIETEPWAKEQFQREFPPIDDYEKEIPIKNLFRYLVLGDKRAAEVEKETLLKFIGHPTLQKDVWGWQWHHANTWQHALRYDALYDLLTSGQRKALDDTFRTFAKYGIEEEPLRGFGSYGRHPGEHICALPTRDQRLIAGMFACKGGIKDLFDNLDDGYFAQVGALGEIMMWCRACERMELDEFGFGYKGQNGGSLRRYFEGFAASALPRIEVPDGTPYYGRMQPGGKSHAAYAEGFPRSVFPPPIIVGYRPAAKASEAASKWQGGMAHWLPQGSAGIYGGDRGVWRMGVPLVLELAHRKWPDAGFDYYLAQLRKPGEDKYYPSLYFGLQPIDSRTVKPPMARSALYPSTGLAILRAQEGAAFLEGPAPAAVLAGATGTAAWNGGALGIAEFYAFNRPLFTTPLSPMGDREWNGSWVHSGRSNSTVVVDNLQFETLIEKDQYVRRTSWPRAMGQVPARSGFDSLVKFASFRAKPVEVEEISPDGIAEKVTRQIYPGVDMERGLMLTGEYLFDVFRVSSDRPRQYHWIIHALGQAQLGSPDEWKSSGDLDRDLRDARGDDSTCLDAKGKTRFVKGSGAPPTYRFGQQRSNAAGGKNWSVAAIQRRGDPNAALPAAWYDRGIGVRVNVLGEEGTTAYVACPIELTWKEAEPSAPRRGPRDTKPEDPDKSVNELELLPAGSSPVKPDEKKEPATKSARKLVCTERPIVEADAGLVTIVASRKCVATVFVALHEPFERTQWKIDSFQRIAQTERGVAVAVSAKDSPVNDRVMMRYGERPEQPITLAGDGESFTFSDRAFVRIGRDKVEVRGPLTAMKVKVEGQPKLMLNGKEHPASLTGGYLILPN